LDLRGRKWQEAEEGCITKSYIACMLHQIKESEVGGARIMHRRDEKCIQYFCWKIWKEVTSLKTRCRWDGNIIMDLREVG
jgi:hypothetical protein